MSEELIQYMSQEKLDMLRAEWQLLKNTKVPELAKRIDEARQLGDLSENAEYHAAREEMAWVQSRVKELEHIIDHAQVVGAASSHNSVTIGSVVTVLYQGRERIFTIVGAQEANPPAGKISNESPLGLALLGKRKGDGVEITAPSGVQQYEVVAIN